MNHKEYLELLTEDLNILFREEKTNDASQKEKEHSFRVQILIFHLHVDYLLTEIIKEKFKNEGISEIKEFLRKLKIVYGTGDFDEGFLTSFDTLNKVRNKLVHNLRAKIQDEEKKIRSLKVSPALVSWEDLRNLTPLEHLLYSSIGYLNILAEYLYEKVKGDKPRWFLSFQMPEKERGYIITSIIERPDLKNMI